jgi:MFS family permease
MRRPNVRRYLIGQTISFIGSFAQGFAQVLLVLDISNDKLAVPLVLALQTLPLLLLGSFAGSVADRVDNRRLLLGTTVASAFLAALLGVVVAFDRATVAVVSGFALVYGMVAVFERPAAQAILSELAPADEIAGVVSLNAMIPPIARLAGPPLAGLLTAVGGFSIAFYANALSYAAVAYAVVRMQRADMFERRKATQRKGLVKAGFVYARSDPIVGPTLALMFIVGFAAFNFSTALPLMAKFTFGLKPSDSHDAGLIALVQTVSAVGSLFAGVVIGWFSKPTVITQAVWAVIFGVSLVGMGVAPTYWWWVVVALPVGVMATGFTTVTTMILQTSSRPEMLGRVMALFSIAFLGTTPLGALVVAWLGSVINARAPFVAGGVATAVGGLALFVRGRRIAALAVAGPTV